MGGLGRAEPGSAGHSSAQGEDTEHNKLKKRKNQSALQRLKDKIREKKQASYHSGTVWSLCASVRKAGKQVPKKEEDIS